MIRISAIDAGSGAVTSITSQSVSNSYVVKIGLVDVTKEAQISVSRPNGILEQGTKSWGDLREKSVQHTRIVADLIHEGTTHIFGTSGSKYIFKQQNGVEILFDHIVLWGEDSNSWGTSGYWYQTTRERHFYETHWGKIHFNQDGIRAIYTDYRETSVYSKTGAYITTEFAKRMQKIYRLNGKFYGFTTQTWGGVGGCEEFNSLAISTAMSFAVSGGLLISPVTYQTTGSMPTVAQLEAVLSLVEVNHTYQHMDYNLRGVDMGDLAVECAAQLKYVDTNLLGDVFDILDWRNFVGSCKDLLSMRMWQTSLAAYKSVVNRKKSTAEGIIAMMKPFTSGYLFSKYAVLTSVSDICSLARGAKKFSSYLQRQRLHSRRVTSYNHAPYSTYTHTAVVTCVCATYPTSLTDNLQRLIGEAKKWGAWPEVTNLWDRLQYSFVLDWVVQYGDFFEEVNTYMDMKWYFPVQYCIQSEKWVGSRSCADLLPGLPVTGTVDSVHYSRWITKEVPLPSVSLSAEFQLGNHLVESTALVIQRL